MSITTWRKCKNCSRSDFLLSCGLAKHEESCLPRFRSHKKPVLKRLKQKSPQLKRKKSKISEENIYFKIVKVCFLKQKFIYYTFFQGFPAMNAKKNSLVLNCLKTTLGLKSCSHPWNVQTALDRISCYTAAWLDMRRCALTSMLLI